MRYWVSWLIVTIGALGFGGKAFGADSKIKVDIKFEYKDTPLRIKLYEVTPEFVYSTARTALAKKMKDLPVTKPMASSILFSDKLKAKTFALVVENSSAENKYFFATPHTLDPVQASLGVLFECLCNHHVYKIPPKQIWYRIVRLKVDTSEANMKKVKHVKVVHSFVEVPEQDALKNYRSMFYDQDTTVQEQP